MYSAEERAIIYKASGIAQDMDDLIADEKIDRAKLSAIYDDFEELRAANPNYKSVEDILHNTEIKMRDLEADWEEQEASVMEAQTTAKK